MYGPAAVGVGEWYVYESFKGVEGPGAEGITDSDIAEVPEMVKMRDATRQPRSCTIDALFGSWPLSTPTLRHPQY